MTERLIAKLDRLGAEAGIKEMTPEIYRFAQLLNDDKLKQWDEWRANREWVELTDAEIDEESSDYYEPGYEYGFRKGAVWAEDKLKEKNT
jgi:antibiotic biosynthesis monooxygenase (ABM) superfamily enzyme